MTQPPSGAPNQPYPYPGYPPPEPPPVKRTNVIGLIAVIAAVIGFVLACVPGALVVGWVLLPIALILGIVGVCQSGRPKSTSITAIIISIVGFVVGAVVFFVVVGNAFHDAFHTSDLSAPTAAPGGSAHPATTSAEATPSTEQGSRANPFPIGTPVTNKDWQVTLGAPREAGAEVAAENQFNDSPKAGMQFWIVPVTATYTGDTTGNLAFGISVKFVGADNVTYDDRCGVIPTPLDDVGDLYKDGTAQGNVCVAVPAGADGLWSLATGFGAPAFFTAR
jgi:hypothetical protein